MNIILIYFAIKYKGNWDAIYKALEEKEKVSLPELNALEKEIKDKGWKILTILDIDYPNKLKEAYKPPFVLWLDGDRKILENKFLCVTGNNVDELTQSRIDKFIPEIGKGHGITTASYKGVDQKVLDKSNAPKLVVLANGITKPYTNHERKENELFITEYPPEAHATKDTFRNRNRLIAAFSESLILFSTIKDGPINNLVTNFLNLGKEIYAFAGDGSDTDGNSELIKQGANLITGIKDISC